MDTDYLASLIERKHQALLRLQGLAERQLRTVGEGDLGPLLGLLAAKQQVLNDLQAVESALVPFRQQDPESRRWRSPGERERVRSLAEQCELVLRDIVQLEARSEQELAQRRDTAAARLQGTHNALLARRAYVGSLAKSGGQLDVSSDT